MTAPAIKYPAGDTVTPHGWWHIINDTRPTMRLRAYDGSIEFYLMGGLAPPYNDPALPEAAALKSLKGLIGPWKHIDQKGATEDGVTQVDALYDPVEVEMVVECIARDPQHLRRVHRDLIASLDAKRESELSFNTQDLGHWWAPIRWFKGAPTDPMQNPQTRRQKVSLRLRADSGFWRSYDDVDSFRFVYESMLDTFTTDYSGAQNLGPNWPQYYSGTGGYCSTTTAASGHQQARWYESGNAAREVVNGPYAGFSTDTDSQVAEVVLGSFPEFTFIGGTSNTVLARMGRDVNGDWNGDAICGRVGLDGTVAYVQLSRFNDFVETVMSRQIMLVSPLYGEKFSLLCGADDDPRLFRILRNGLPILSHKETAAGSVLGATHRGVGFGMAAANAGAFGQASPAWVRKVSAGDNATVTQSGFLRRLNIGDQPMYDDYTVFGPGTFRFYDGPGTDEYVQFGPLLGNQVVFVRTDPRTNTTLVQDLTSTPPTPQQLTVFQEALTSFASFAFANNVPPLFQQILSQFGVIPPQGNLYKYLSGRFSDNAAIPPKSPGNEAAPYYVKVEIVGGNADSKVIASGTPLLRYPI